MTETVREKLLLQMYDQMFNDINRHIMVVWQSVGVVVGALALFTLVEKNVLPLDIATSLIVILCGWLLAHLLDASYWYNRNLVIIANIERQFLDRKDLGLIHYYFGAHRPKNRMIMHLLIQFILGILIGGLFLSYHFIDRVQPGLSSPWSAFDAVRAIPYILCVAGLILLAWLRRRKNANYQEFLENSPGLAIDASGIKYGPGHGFKKKDSQPSDDSGRQSDAPVGS